MSLLPALELLYPQPPKTSKRRHILALLEGRVTTWGTIRHWVKGRHPPPLWARQILAAELLRENDRRAAVAKMLLSENEKAPD